MKKPYRLERFVNGEWKIKSCFANKDNAIMKLKLWQKALGDMWKVSKKGEELPVYISKSASYKLDTPNLKVEVANINISLQRV